MPRSSNQNAGFRILEETVCEAIPASSLAEKTATGPVARRAEIEVLQIAEELVFDAGGNSPAEPDVKKRRTRRPGSNSASAAAKPLTSTFRHSAGFGKRIEFWIIGKMLKEGLDVYVPLVDDDAIDVVIRRPNQSFTTVQIKARSRACAAGDAGLFAAIPHELRENYWFVFYSERMDMTWIMTSAEFIAAAHQNKTGKHKGKRTIWFNGRTTEKSGSVVEHCKPQFFKYVAANFQRLLAGEIEPREAPERGVG